MRILHVLQSIAPAYGGPVQALRTYAKWLAAAGEDVTVATTNHDVPKGRVPGLTNMPIQEDGYVVWRFETTFHPYAYSVQMGKWLAGNIDTFDVVHIHGLYRYPPIAAARIARDRGVPYIMRPYGSLDPYLHNKAERRTFKRIHELFFDFPALNHASAIQYTAEDERRLVQPLGLRAPTTVIPIGLDAKIFDRPDLDGRMRAKLGIGDRPLLLFFGRLAQKKGLDISIKAFARVRAKIPNALFVIAGPDNEGMRPLIERWLDESGVRDAAILPGMIDGDDRIGLLRDADLFVLQSHTENFGISVVEAMAAGTPVVISDQINLWRDVVEYDAGLVTPCDPDLAAEAMLKAMEDKTLRAKLLNGGEKLLSERYSREAVTQQLMSLYRDVARK